FPPGAAPLGSIHADAIRTRHTGVLEALLAIGGRDGARREPNAIPIALGLKTKSGGARIDFPGFFRTSPPALQVAIDGTLPFAADGLKPADLAPEAAKLLERAVGTVTLKGGVKAGRGPPTFNVRVATESLDLVTATGVPIEGLAFSADVRGPSPLRTGEHTLRFRTANLIGPFEDGTVRWRLRGTDLEVLAAEWSYAGGRCTTAGHFDLTAKEWPFTVDVAGVSLEQLLAQLEIADLAGSGSLSGALPLVFDGTRLRVEGGVLTAAPPGGVVRYAPASAAPGSLGLGGDVDVLAGALEDFHYDKLRMTLTGALDGDVEVGLEIDGKNPRYEGGRPIELNVKVETNLPALLRASRSVSGVPEVIERRLRGRVPEDE
ncbi:MAG TPA: YdbH domain-containing protein, partial [Myxococcota bacterium]|nr:YdbH domain-containing protein [Myxococcota bacterium]